MKKYFSKIDGILYFILFFCAVGVLRNALYLFNFGFDYQSIPTKVFIAMIAIYGAQVILILMRQRAAFVISALQAFFCFYVYEDFTFLPFANAFKMIVAAFSPNLEYGWAMFFSTVTASALLSLELLKTYLIYVLTDEPPKKKKKKKVKTQQSEAEEEPKPETESEIESIEKPA